MTFIEDINKKYGKHYVIKAICQNCGNYQDIQIPKGVTIKEYSKNINAKCKFCGCSTLIFKKNEK